MNPTLHTATVNGRSVITISGNWSVDHAEELARYKQLVSNETETVVSGSDLESIDTFGGMALLNIAGINHKRVDFKSHHENIVKLVAERWKKEVIPPNTPRPSVIAKIGEGFLNGVKYALGLFSFMGEAATSLFKSIRYPKLFRLRELVVQLEGCFIDAIPIVGLVTFLIGIVVAYLFADQIVKFGANILIVDGVAIAMCRELSPLIVAIIIAGRSGSAFTAHIGTMKLNEEIDALSALGLSPMHILVIPRVLALMIAMPLLVFVGDCVGIIGGILIADLKLDITLTTFIDRLGIILTVKSFMVGLIKAPVFAAVIGLIGCRMGLSVENNARSVGLNTTSTVVQSIVAVILINAAFAVLFVELGV